MYLNKSYFAITSEFCLLILKQRLHREFQVWIVLKSKSDGNLHKTKGLINEVAHEIEKSARTVERALSRAIERNWIGYNKRNKKLYPRGIDVVRQIENLENQRAYNFYIEDVLNVKAYCMSALITDLIINQKRKILEGERSFKGINRRFKLPSHYPVSLKSLEKIYGFSIRMASVLRREAHNSGYIKMKPDFSYYLVQGSKISYRELRANIKHVPEELQNKISNQNGIAVITKPHKIQSLLEKRYRKILRTKLDT